MSKTSVRRIVLFGAPGSGKGTQASILSEKLSLPIIATGNILREIVTQKSHPMYETIDSIISKGNLLPATLLKDLLDEKIGECCKKGIGFILDGYPRNLEQIKHLDEVIARYTAPITHAIQIEVLDDVIIDRIVGRFSCAKCYEVYHNKHRPLVKKGVCDKCGATNFSYRDDDKEEVIRKRLRIYHEETKPVIQQYDDLKLLHTVDGNLPMRQVTNSIIDSFSSTI